jgi:hypothetical protein
MVLRRISRPFPSKLILLGHDKCSEVGFAVADSQFLSDAVALEIDRALGRVKDPGDILGGTAFLDKNQDLDFPGGQLRISG